MLIEVNSAFIGLRSYDANEVDIFFGREEQVDQLLDRLNNQHFLAVVGPSGCGKSSLVRAGLIGALRSGLLAKHGPRWRVAEFRPGSDPFRRLARSLHASAFFPTLYEEEEKQLAFLESALHTGPKSIINLYEQSEIDPFANLIIVVDQFEEIFRFRKEESMDEAEALVSLLLETSSRMEHPIFVVLTMRSEYLGNCSLFSGLPERLNGSQFLTPRLTREQCQEAIEKPVQLSGGIIDPALTNQLLNDFGSDPDQLPLLQHTLMRMWDLKKDLAEKKLDLETYDAVGAISNCLSRHADETYNSLENEDKKVIESVFRCLTDNVTQEHAVRRPMKIKKVATITGFNEAEIIHAIEPFRQEGRNFISPPNDILHGETAIDITHESIMRQWEKLKAWMKEENTKARIYKWLADAVQSRRTLLKGIDLTTAKNWLRDEKLNQDWAELYVSSKKEKVGLANVTHYINNSVSRQKKITALYAIPALLLFILVILFSTLFSTSENYKVLYEKEYGSALDQIESNYGPIAAYTSLKAFRSSVRKSLMPFNIGVAITGRDFLLQLDQRLKGILAKDTVFASFPILKDRKENSSGKSEKYNLEINENILFITNKTTHVVIQRPLPNALRSYLDASMINFSYDDNVVYFTGYKEIKNNKFNQTCFFGAIDSTPFREHDLEDGESIVEVTRSDDDEFHLFIREPSKFANWQPKMMFPKYDPQYRPKLVRYNPATGKKTTEKFDLYMLSDIKGQLNPCMDSDSNWYFFDKKNAKTKRLNGIGKGFTIIKIMQNDQDTILIDGDNKIVYRSRSTHVIKSEDLNKDAILKNFTLNGPWLFMSYQVMPAYDGTKTWEGLLVFNIQNETIKAFPVTSRVGFEVEHVEQGFAMIYDRGLYRKSLLVLDKIKDLNSIPVNFRYSEADLIEMRIQTDQQK